MALIVLGALGPVMDVETAQATAIRIELDAPPDCSTAEAFYESVRARTERARPVREGETGVRVVVRLTRVGARAHGELRVIGDRGESDTRRVDGNSCTEVVEALSLTVALAVDPTARLAPVEREQESARVEAPPPPPPPAPPPPPPPPPPPAPRRVELRLGVHASGAGQVTPFVSYGADLSFRAIAPWDAAPSLGLSLVRWQNDLVASAEHASVRSTLFALTACPKRFGERASFTFEPCARGVAGWLSATGRGVAERVAVLRSYVAGGGVLIGTAPFAEVWAVELEAGFLIPAVKRRFLLSNPARQVAETPDISAFGALGLTYSF